MKKTIILAVFAILFVFGPQKAHADFNFGRIIDPLCVFSCNDKKPKPKTVINNTTNNTTNSNNVNSNINSNITTTGTLTPVYAYDNDHDYNTSRLGVSCYSNPSSASVGESVRWGASPYGGNGNYYVTWSGSEGLSGNGTSISKRYNYSGSKNASVTVTSGNQTISRNCNTVDVYGDNYYDNTPNYDYNNNYDYNHNNSQIYVSCSVNTTFAPVGTNVIWTAYASGGNGNYSYEWNGTDYLRGSGQPLSISYNAPGQKTASVTVRSGSRSTTQSCSGSVLVGAPVYNNNYGNNYVQPAPVVKYVTKIVKEVPEKVVEKDNSMSAASLFSLSNVPWGLVAILVILVLLGTVVYLAVNKNKI